MALSTNRRIMSGIQATGIPHIGNYLGAIRKWVHMQDDVEENKTLGNDGKLIYSVVNLHALTVSRDSEVLRKNSRDMIASLLACGIHPEKSILFQQSDVSEHSELLWILSCITPMSWLNRMTQYKEKSIQAGANLGLFSYPVLMAADILLYKSTDVPVGDDQKQHLELAVDIVNSFNQRYKKNVLVVPKPFYGESMYSRIKSLGNGSKKMSKSDPSELSRIDLTDTVDQIAKKIKRATTDSIPGITFDPENRPEIANLTAIYAALSGREIHQVVHEFERATTKQFKDALIDVLVTTICPIGEAIQRYQKDQEYLQKVLDDGASKATAIASATLKEVKETVGL